MTVTADKLARAIQGRLDLPPAEAAAVARRVLDYFGFESVIIDNMVDAEDRKLFYSLHDAGLLRSSLESVILPSGKTWRIFYWELDERTLDRDPRRDRGASRAGPYGELPDEVWTSHATPA